jgi:uncharacterized RDD family membrane protein YckC
VSDGPSAGIGQAASISRRVWAYLFDGVPITLLNNFAAFGLGLDVSWLLLVFFTSFQAYFAAFWSFGGGQTPGMRLLGIRVVQVDGRPVDPLRALRRSLVWFFGSFLAITPISVLVSADHRGLHDRAANTIVVRAVRTPAS